MENAINENQVTMQGKKALNEMCQAKENYCKMKDRTPFAMDLFDGILFASDGGDCCCLGMILIIIVAIPCLIIWQFEKHYLDKKAKNIMLQAKRECDLYLQYLQEYLKTHPDNRISMNASIAFVRNSYIGTLNKEKKFFGFLQKDEDWRIHSIEMAMQEVRGHLQLVENND